MENDDDEFDQAVFENGDVVADSDVGDDELVEPSRETGFNLEVREDALQVNALLEEIRSRHGDVLSFDSRNAAEAYADRLGENGGDLRVQRAAPQDDRDVDAYLLADHDPSIYEPAKIEGDKWTFDVGANLHGALGETLVKSGLRPPALAYFVENDLEINPEELQIGLRIRVAGADSVSGEDLPGGWVPDCVVEARDGWNGEILERYWCEIKTGNASFERSQVETMESLAEENRVLTIRVFIDELPDQYSVIVHEVEPTKETSF